MSWADEASREATLAAEHRNSQIVNPPFMRKNWAGDDIMDGELPGLWENSDFESHRPVEEECPCESEFHRGKCGSTRLEPGTGFCTTCIFGCLP